ncbi:MAG: replication terminator protein [Syntrophomonadaceae bacterium]|nr:replication terminator protein [Syntrophomonadaceae bacterium]
MEKMTFSNLAGGGAQERLQDALDQVAANIADPNTDAKKTRKITMTLTMKPNEQRSIANLEINVKTSLVSPVGINTTLMVDRDEKGKAVVSEIYGKDPNQGVLDLDPGKITNIAERR